MLTFAVLLIYGYQRYVAYCARRDVMHLLARCGTNSTIWLRLTAFARQPCLIRLPNFIGMGAAPTFHTATTAAAIVPKPVIDISEWTAYADGPPSQLNDCYVILEARLYRRDLHFWNPVQVCEYVRPVAWRTSAEHKHAICVIASSTTHYLVSLLAGHIRGALVFQEGYRVVHLLSVAVTGTALPPPPEVTPTASMPLTAETTSMVTHSDGCVAEDIEKSHSPNPSSSSGENGAVASSEESACVNSVRKYTSRSKPPNILVYTGKKDCVRVANQVMFTLSLCVNTDKYTIYHLTQQQVLSTPWQDNALLLVVASERLYDGVDQAVLRYLEAGGLVISLGSTLDDHLVTRARTAGAAPTTVTHVAYKTLPSVAVIAMPFHYDVKPAASDTNDVTVTPRHDVTVTPLATDTETGAVVMVECRHNASGGRALLSQVRLEQGAAELAISPEVFALLKASNSARHHILRDMFASLGLDSSAGTAPAVTEIRLITQTQTLRDEFRAAVQGRLQSGVLRTRHISLRVCETAGELAPTDDCIPLVLGDSPGRCAGFSADTYWANLGTRRLGRTLLHGQVLPSTMAVLDALLLQLPAEQGAVVVAGRQTAARGRGSNTWLSPPGAALFSLHLRLPLSARLTHAASFVQHLAALAVVHSVRSRPNYENLDIRLKWPNDIYFGDKIKMGGVLVQSSVMADVIYFNIGVGVNVSNSNPTICLNDVIDNYNSTRDLHLGPISLEKLIAKSITTFEGLVDEYEANGADNILEIYYRYWLHSDQTVTVASETELQKHVDRSAPGVSSSWDQCSIVGLDSLGFLQIRASDGSTCSVQPDGNSFDMMRGLIAMKSR